MQVLKFIWVVRIPHLPSWSQNMPRDPMHVEQLVVKAGKLPRQVRHSPRPFVSFYQIRQGCKWRLYTFTTNWGSAVKSSLNE